TGSTASTRSASTAGTDGRGISTRSVSPPGSSTPGSISAQRFATSSRTRFGPSSAEIYASGAGAGPGSPTLRWLSRPCRYQARPRDCPSDVGGSRRRQDDVHLSGAVHADDKPLLDVGAPARAGHD